MSMEYPHSFNSLRVINVPQSWAVTSETKRIVYAKRKSLVHLAEHIRVRRTSKM